MAILISTILVAFYNLNIGKTKRSVLGSLVGTRSLPRKVHPEKKTQSKTRRYLDREVIDRKYDALSITIEFFLIAVFFRGALLQKNSF
jgi:hypothetical protein